MCAIEIERIKSKLGTTASQTTPPPPPPSQVQQTPSGYYEHHQTGHHAQSQQHLRSMPSQQQASNATSSTLYNPSMKIEEGEIIFPSWTPASYNPSYYESAGSHVGLPDITAIKSGGSSADSQHQQRFAKLAELAGESDVGSGYVAAAAAAVAAAAIDNRSIDAYEGRGVPYNAAGELGSARMRGRLDSNRGGEQSILPSIQGMAGQQPNQQGNVNTNANSMNLYDTSAAMSSYEQAAVSLMFISIR